MELDLIVGNTNQVNKLYTRQKFRTHLNVGASLRVDSEVSNISKIMLSPTQTLAINTSIDYYLSNNGGVNYFKVYADKAFTFPTTGSDLRWKARLNSLSPALTPTLSNITLLLIKHAPTSSDASFSLVLNTPKIFTASDANSDADNDGYTNLEEYEAGTDPQDVSSNGFSLLLVGQTKYTLDEQENTRTLSFENDGSYSSVGTFITEDGTYGISPNILTLTQATPSAIDIVHTYLGLDMQVL